MTTDEQHELADMFMEIRCICDARTLMSFEADPQVTDEWFDEHTWRRASFRRLKQAGVISVDWQADGTGVVTVNEKEGG